MLLARGYCLSLKLKAVRLIQWAVSLIQCQDMQEHVVMLNGQWRNFVENKEIDRKDTNDD